MDENQLLTYLRLTGLKLVLVINFGEKRVKDGLHRVVNGLEDQPIFTRTPVRARLPKR